MTMMKGIKGMAMMMMKPHSLIPFRNASAVGALSRNPWNDKYHLDMHNPNDKTHAYLLNKAKRFSLIRDDKKREFPMSSWVELEIGMILLKNYVSVSDQVEIVNTCQKFGMGPGGFYEPLTKDGTSMNLHMMCFGRNWDPITKYDWKYRSDGSEAPPITDQFISLAINSLLEVHASWTPLMDPDVCIVNFCTKTGKLRLHQVRESIRGQVLFPRKEISVKVSYSPTFKI
ncbi:probable DNA N(6)-methyladenine demethylase ALKBH1B [Rutidosis leptorrhynchoides]|uniref:probable DNA N(6)-methyladenine demethylase ALKBH1B n=1 Tax=Rutidosis leptorrhynchoides TaxID=125765 RepID=UPI003A996D76